MKIKALVPFSTGTISMEQYEVREVTDSLGNELISAGVAVEIGGGLPPVTASDAGKVLSVNNSGVWGAGVQEYWIPVTVSGSELYIPNDKVLEVANAIDNADRYWVRGAFMDNAYYPGYVSCHQDFIVPLSKSFMQNLGFDCAGKLHIVEGDGYTVSIEPDKFIVTLTPTAADYSGTMDKTVAEIDAAYEAGRKIVFKVILSATDYLEGALTAVRHFGSWSYDDYIGNIVLPTEGMLITVETLGTDDGTKQTYSTHVYTLTPAT